MPLFFNAMVPIGRALRCRNFKSGDDKKKKREKKKKKEKKKLGVAFTPKETELVNTGLFKGEGKKVN